LGQCIAPDESLHEICSRDSDCDFGDGVCEIPHLGLVEEATVTEIVSVTDSVPGALVGTVGRVILSLVATDSDGSVELLATCPFSVIP
jgi:hypothetical protein